MGEPAFMDLEEGSYSTFENPTWAVVRRNVSPQPRLVIDDRVALSLFRLRRPMHSLVYFSSDLGLEASRVSPVAALLAGLAAGQPLDRPADFSRVATQVIERSSATATVSGTIQAWARDLGAQLGRFAD